MARSLIVGLGNSWLVLTLYRQPFHVGVKHWSARHPTGWYWELTPWERMDG